MTEQHRKENDTDDMRKKTDEAWLRMQAAMAGEQPQAAWEKWNSAAASTAAGVAADEAVSGAPQGDSLRTSAAGMPAQAAAGAAAAEAQSQGGRARRRMGSRARRWTTLAAAALIVVTATATPAGNKALASILGQFRMEQVTEVNQNDMEMLFNSIYQTGASREEINRYGAFQVQTGKENGEFAPAAAEKLLGIKLFPESLVGKHEKVYVNHSQNIDFTLNVGEMNKTMKRLGADKLFPDSVDGKKISLEMGAVVQYDTPLEGASYAQISQTKAPSITVDPSVDVKDAMEAVVQFPLLPDQLRQSLKQSQLAENGEIPLPVWVRDGGGSERIDVGGTSVVLTTEKYGKSTQLEATWVKDGILTRYTGNWEGKADEEAFRAKLQELVNA